MYNGEEIHRQDIDLERSGFMMEDQQVQTGGECTLKDKERIPMIRVKNLYKIYKVGKNKVYALNGVDFTMYKGEFCAIVGPSSRYRHIRQREIYAFEYAGRAGEAV